MEYSFFDRLKMMAFKHRSVVVFLLCFIIISCLIGIMMISFAKFSRANEFDEIQKYFADLKKHDEFIHNNIKVKEIEKVVKGIDVSSWQGDIVWDKVKNSGIDFVMIRCGYRSVSEDDIKIDSKFVYNVKEANRLDIPVGIYFYSTARDEFEVLEEASFVLNLIRDYKITYPIVYDFELFNQKRTANVSNEIINNNALKFLNYINDHGYIGMLYTNLYAINNYWDMKLFKDYKIWYAQYVDKSSYEGIYEMWQYTSNGRIDGIIGNVDLNEAYIAYEEI